jgi:uncharacterized coiled-coil protein SlyX
MDKAREAGVDLKKSDIKYNQSDAEEHIYRLECVLKKQEKEIDELKMLLEKQQVIIRRIYAEHLPDTWFVCGELGEKDQNNLPKYIEVCPAYGADWSQVYERTDRTIGGMGS